MQVCAEITLISPDVVTSLLGTASAPQSPSILAQTIIALSRSEMVTFQCTVQVEGPESKGSERV